MSRGDCPMLSRNHAMADVNQGDCAKLRGGHIKSGLYHLVMLIKGTRNQNTEPLCEF